MRPITELSNDELLSLGSIGTPSTSIFNKADYTPSTFTNSVGIAGMIAEDEETKENMKKWIGPAEQYITGNKILRLDSNDLDATLGDAGWSPQDIDRYYVKIGLRR